MTSYKGLAQGDAAVVHRRQFTGVHRKTGGAQPFSQGFKQQFVLHTATGEDHIGYPGLLPDTIEDLA